jgi:hypothetical protein
MKNCVVHKKPHWNNQSGVLKSLKKFVAPADRLSNPLRQLYAVSQQVMREIGNVKRFDGSGWVLK